MPEAARKSWNRHCSRRVLPVPETTEGAHDMPYLSGVLTGILVTILASISSIISGLKRTPRIS
jgi:hypothetical protein